MRVSQENRCKKEKNSLHFTEKSIIVCFKTIKIQFLCFINFVNVFSIFSYIPFFYNHLFLSKKLSNLFFNVFCYCRSDSAIYMTFGYFG